MADENGVRVTVIRIELRHEMMLRTIHLDMTAIVHEDHFYDSQPGMSDLNKLNRLYEWQGGRGLWLTVPPKEIIPVKVVQVKERHRRIIIDD